MPSRSPRGIILLGQVKVADNNGYNLQNQIYKPIKENFILY